MILVVSSAHSMMVMGALQPFLCRLKQAESYAPKHNQRNATVDAKLKRMNESKNAGLSQTRRPYSNKLYQAGLNGSSRGVLPVICAMALANAGASGGRPGSPMPFGGSALETMCTVTCGMSVMRGTA